MLQLLWKYIIGPIIADARGAETAVWNGITATTGYNIFNTIFYAATAATIIYLIYQLINKKDVQITTQTAINTTPFILLGGTLRFLDDVQLIPFPYSITLVTPLVYFLIASIYIPAIYKLKDKQILKLGIALLVPSLAYAATAFTSFNIVYATATIALTTVLTAAYYFIVEENYQAPYLVLLAFTQFFEGSASMISSFYGYNAKQLLAQQFNNILGLSGVLVMKTMVLALAISVITDIEEKALKSISLIILYSIGLGTGFRVFLRVLAGA